MSDAHFALPPWKQRHVYVLRCENDCYYVGITTNIRGIAETVRKSDSKFLKDNPVIEIELLTVGTSETLIKLTAVYDAYAGEDKVKSMVRSKRTLEKYQEYESRFK